MMSFMKTPYDVIISEILVDSKRCISYHINSSYDLAAEIIYVYIDVQ